MTPDERIDRKYAGSLEHQFRVFDRRFTLLSGLYVEHNDRTGTEWLGEIRAEWAFSRSRRIWTSINRGVAVPSFLEQDTRINTRTSPYAIYPILGNPSLKSSDVLSWEVGFDGSLSTEVDLQLRAFYSTFENLQSLEALIPRRESPPFRPFHLRYPFALSNDLEAASRGLEGQLQWRPNERWRLRLTYAYLDVDTDLDEATALQNDQVIKRVSRQRLAQLLAPFGLGYFDNVSQINAVADGESPRHAASLWSSVNLPKNVFMDTIFRYVEELPALGVDSYYNLDLHVAWRPREDFEAAVTLRNLLSPHHREFRSIYLPVVNATEVERGVQVEASWRF